MDEQQIREQDERPFRDAGYPAGPVSMGGGRVVTVGWGEAKDCPKGKTGCKATAVSCIQSVEHFVCNEECGKEWWD